MGYGQSDARGYVNARDMIELQRRREVGEWWRRYETARAWDRFLDANGPLEYLRQRYGVGR